MQSKIHKRGGPRLLMPDGWQKKIDKGICPVCGGKNHRGTDQRPYYCCSKECTKGFWKKACWSNVLRGRCFERDNHTCQKCGTNNKASEAWQERFEKWLEPYYKKLPKGFTRSGYYGQWFSKELGRITTPAEVYTHLTGDKCPKTVYFEADHIVPVALGGDQYDLNNYQTLCERCHGRKTAREAKQFAAARQGRQTLTEAIVQGQQKKLEVIKHGT